MNLFFLQLYLWTSKTHKSRLKKSYKIDLYMVALVAVGGFLMKKLPNNYLSSQ